jgi:hypothetical protein
MVVEADGAEPDRTATDDEIIPLPERCRDGLSS